MGVNNRKRRAAKQRKQERAQRASQRPEERPAAGESWDADAAYASVEQRVRTAVRVLRLKKLTEAHLVQVAELLLARTKPYPEHVLSIVLHDLMSAVIEGVAAGGWSPGDLSELVRRNLGAAHLPTLAAALREQEGSRRRGQTWRDAIDLMGCEPALNIGAHGEVSSLLGLVALLRGVPLLTDAIASTAAAPGPEHPKLARVRALLAKAESTEYDEEAEALSAKAQELISRYALDRLLDGGSERDSSDLAVRRVWLDAPYVRAKTLLVSAVASANRCRAASAERLGFTVVVGAAADLDAVELLVTSLLVQADAAMLRHGRRTAASGVTRTKSFRQSFLTAYATRIGERLAAVNATAARAAGADLLPVLRSQEAKVTDAFDRMVPHTIGRSASVSNGDGWIAGLAAADLAAIDVSARLDQAGRTA
ncbi:DUF2786 domain-containing protein [Nocardioides zhouii]|nr:DUF2786 domain-containing protein [Nocardioides zhouii]